MDAWNILLGVVVVADTTDQKPLDMIIDMQGIDGYGSHACSVNQFNMAS